MSYSVTFKTTQYHTGRITSQLRDALPRYIAIAKKHPERFVKGAIFTLAESDWAADFLAFSGAMTAKPKALMDGKQILFKEDRYCHEHVYLAAHLLLDELLSLEYDTEATERLLIRISASIVIANADIVDREKTKQARTLAAKMKRDAKRKKRALCAICA